MIIINLVVRICCCRWTSTKISSDETQTKTLKELGKNKKPEDFQTIIIRLDTEGNQNEISEHNSTLQIARKDSHPLSGYVFPRIDNN
ncbi:unnamed protein product [Blepharisma stoltei]|uniref:Uncharacterized protein n=1 Tax=Blepharisma stoltei TaxID=1481888 RepID=A0AAU9IL07_9CILI|nr:unnamed protein product [Blepharisma stoltei]